MSYKIQKLKFQYQGKKPSRSDVR